jgi:hypothetical protein
MTIEIFDCDQGSEEWFEARRGIPTASCFDKVLTKPRKGESVSLTRRRYLRDLAGEIITGKPMESYSNWHMERGKGMEPEARELYAFAHDAELTQVGFIRTQTGLLSAGCSPDSLIGNDGLLEIKTKLPALLIECIEADQFPPEHKAQCQGALLVTGRDWIDLVAYWPGMPLFVKRAYRDEEYIKNLSGELCRFSDDLDELVDRIRRYGNPTPITHTLKAALEMEHGISQ